MKDEALSPVAFLMESLPIAAPTDETRAASEEATRRLIVIADEQAATRRMLLDWLRTDHGVETATTKLSDPIALDSDGFVAEVKKSRGKGTTLTSANLARLREEYARSIPPARALASEALALESRLSDLVNAAYGLTPADVSLLWDTAPPRMPIPRPESPEAS